MTLAGILPPALLAALLPFGRAASFFVETFWIVSLIWLAWSIRGFLAEALWRRLGLDGHDLE